MKMYFVLLTMATSFGSGLLDSLGLVKSSMHTFT